ncbi:hypothetical protein J3Q64DRAFT_1706539, partial [Phycomyces blakesleeanus]
MPCIFNDLQSSYNLLEHSLDNISPPLPQSLLPTATSLNSLSRNFSSTRQSSILSCDKYPQHLTKSVFSTSDSPTTTMTKKSKRITNDGTNSGNGNGNSNDEENYYYNYNYYSTSNRDCIQPKHQTQSLSHSLSSQSSAAYSIRPKHLYNQKQQQQQTTNSILGVSNRRTHSMSKSTVDKSKLQSILQAYLLSPDPLKAGEQKAVIMVKYQYQYQYQYKY